MKKANTYNLLLSLQHTLIDAASSLVVFSTIKVNNVPISSTLSLIFLYNLIAFGTEFLFGYISDKYNLGQIYVILSILLSLLAISLISLSPLTPVIVVGIANSIFHVGGGSIVLKTSRYKAAYSGIFIAPGAVGLVIGTIYAHSQILMLLITLLLMVFALVNLVVYRTFDYTKNTIEIGEDHPFTKQVSIVFLCLFLIVVLRSLIGFSIPFPWRNTLPNAAAIITIFIFLGKILGGAIAEKKGLLKTGLFSLALSIPLILIGIYIPFLGMLGVLMFQMTTAITLVLIYLIIPKNPGVSFGFTTLALFIGGIPMITDNLDPIKNPAFLGSAGALAVAFLVIVKFVFNKYKIGSEKGIINI